MPLLVSILYAVLCLLIDAALVRCRPAAARDVELLALRHEVRVPRRTAKPNRWRPGDRLVLTALSRALTRSDWGWLPVRPETAGLAPRSGAAQVGCLRPPPTDGQAAVVDRVARPRSSTGPGESCLGLPADSRGAAQARPRRLGDGDPDDPPTQRSSAGAAPGGTLVADFPPRARRGRARMRRR